MSPPPLRRALALPLAALLLAMSTAPLSTYEVDTHRALSNAAVHHSGCRVDDYLKNQRILPDGINTAVGGGTLVDRLEAGAEKDSRIARPPTAAC